MSHLRYVIAIADDLHFAKAAMDLEQHALRKFLAVVEELNFNRAAQRLHVSQPALSRELSGRLRTSA